MVVSHVMVANFASLSICTTVLSSGLRLNETQTVSEAWRLTIAIFLQAHLRPTCGFLLSCLQIAIEPSILFRYSFVINAGLEPGVSILGWFCKMCMHLENIGFLPVLWGS